MKPLRYYLICSLIVLLQSFTLSGQMRETEVVDSTRPEAWAMRYYAAVTLMHGNGIPSRQLGPGEYAMGMEAANIPHLSERKRTVGFYGTKEENLNKAPVLVRPLFHYGLFERTTVTASYVPPVKFFPRLRTHLIGLSVRHDVFMQGPWTGHIRMVGQWSEARGDFTVSADIAGDPDPARNPFGAEQPSNDTFTSLTGTLEAGIDYQLPTNRNTSVFMHAAYTRAKHRFQVDAHLADGFHDQARLSSSGGIWSFSGGARTDLTERTELSLMVVYVPLEVRRRPQLPQENNPLIHARLAVNVRL